MTVFCLVEPSPADNCCEGAFRTARWRAIVGWHSMADEQMCISADTLVQAVHQHRSATHAHTSCEHTW